MTRNAPRALVGQLWRHGGDEKHRVIREVRIDRVDTGFAYGTGVQSGRETRIRLDSALALPSPWYVIDGGVSGS